MSLLTPPELDDFKVAIRRMRPVQRPSGWVTDPSKERLKVITAEYQPNCIEAILPNGRKLLVPSAQDRIIQGAIQAALYSRVEKLKDPKLAECKGTQKALEKVKTYIEKHPTGAFYKTDIKGFFTSLDQTKTLDTVTSKLDITDEWTLKAIAATIKTAPKGIPQGSPLSPLLAECILLDLDTKMLQHNVEYLRYVDDILILGEHKDIDQATKELQNYLPLFGLTTNAEKTHIGNYPEQGFNLLGESFFNSPPKKEEGILLQIEGGSKALGLTEYNGEDKTEKTIIALGEGRKESKGKITFSKGHVLKLLMEKPSLDIIELLISPECKKTSPWGSKLQENKNKMIHAGYGKALHDSAFKTYVGKVKACHEAGQPVPIKEAATVFRTLLVANEILKTGSFPESLSTHNLNYQVAIGQLQSGNYQAYRDEISKLFKENYKLRQNPPLKTTMPYEEEINNGIDCLDV